MPGNKKLMDVPNKDSKGISASKGNRYDYEGLKSWKPSRQDSFVRWQRMNH